MKIVDLCTAIAEDDESIELFRCILQFDRSEEL